MSINTDYSFFEDYSFFSATKKQIESLKLPNNFLSFEINESEIADHREQFKTIVKQLSNMGIVMAVDQYTGRYLSPKAISDIGFHEIKLSRSLLKNIDNDRQRFEDIKYLMLDVKNNGMKNAVVGVENIDQYLLIKEIDSTTLIQGYYFYHPLEKQNLIDTLRLVNKTF
ncbi:MAG: EAL domain-containing protein [Erysipelotrichia bacterium]|nr:EAL domain-containing protein [Erysipelotrichia bacterium]